jgi:hypothetical protein
MSVDVWKPPLAQIARSVKPGDGTPPGEKRGDLDLVRDHQLPSANGSNRLKRSDRISEMEQEAPTRDDIERPEVLGIELIRASLKGYDCGLLELDREPQSNSLLGSRDPAQKLNPTLAQMRRPVPLSVIRKVCSNNLRGASALQLKSKEAVCCAYVQTALPLDVRPRQLFDAAPQIEPPWRQDAGGHLDRVIPVRVRFNRRLSVMGSSLPLRIYRVAH